MGFGREDQFFWVLFCFSFLLKAGGCGTASPSWQVDFALDFRRVAGGFLGSLDLAQNGYTACCEILFWNRHEADHASVWEHVQRAAHV